MKLALNTSRKKIPFTSKDFKLFGGFRPGVHFHRCIILPMVPAILWTNPNRFGIVAIHFQ